MKKAIVCLALMLLASPAFSQERVLGLLTLPEVFGGGQCSPFDPRSIALHESPNDSFAFATIQVDKNWSFAPHGGCDGLEVSVHKGKDTSELPTREYDYERPAAIVTDHRDGWFKIRLSEGNGWLKASVVDHFLPLAQLFEEFDGLTTISEAFNGRLANAPAVASGPIMMQLVPKQPVRVVETREAGGRPWLRIEVLSNSACTAANDGPPTVVSEGWLPMHAPNGEPTVWFSSRGC